MKKQDMYYVYNKAIFKDNLLKLFSKLLFGFTIIYTKEKFLHFESAFNSQDKFIRKHWIKTISTTWKSKIGVR